MATFYYSYYSFVNFSLPCHWTMNGTDCPDYVVSTVLFWSTEERAVTSSMRACTHAGMHARTYAGMNAGTHAGMHFAYTHASRHAHRYAFKHACKQGI